MTPWDNEIGLVIRRFCKLWGPLGIAAVLNACNSADTAPAFRDDGGPRRGPATLTEPLTTADARPGTDAIADAFTTGTDAATERTFNDWWPGTYDAEGSPTPADGHHNSGAICLNCHDTNRVWLYGGTVYTAGGTKPASHVQVGIRDGQNFFTAYSAANGNIWLDKGGKSIDWQQAEIRIRNAKGEQIMHGVGNANCNVCHPDGHRIVAP